MNNLSTRLRSELLLKHIDQSSLAKLGGLLDYIVQNVVETELSSYTKDNLELISMIVYTNKSAHIIKTFIIKNITVSNFQQLNGRTDIDVIMLVKEGDNIIANYNSLVSNGVKIIEIVFDVKAKSDAFLDVMYFVNTHQHLAKIIRFKFCESIMQQELNLLRSACAFKNDFEFLKQVEIFSSLVL